MQCIITGKILNSACGLKKDNQTSRLWKDWSILKFLNFKKSRVREFMFEVILLSTDYNRFYSHYIKHRTPLASEISGTSLNVYIINKWNINWRISTWYFKIETIHFVTRLAFLLWVIHWHLLEINKLNSRINVKLAF